MLDRRLLFVYDTQGGLMETIFERTLLFDFYGELLTERQQEIYEDVVMNDMSLSEAAEAYGISRQGIHDTLRRCERAMQEMEQKLHAVEQFEKVRRAVESMDRILTDPGNGIPEETNEKLRGLTAEIMRDIG